MELDQRRQVTGPIPGPNSRSLMERRASAIARGVSQTAPIFARSASGAVVEDVDGNRLIDLGAGLAVLNVGNSAPAVQAAIREQLEHLTHTCQHVVLSEPYLELAERLNALAPGIASKRTMFANSGAEAVENAVKIARHATGRPGVVVVDHAFHGRTLLAMSLTAKQSYKRGFGPFAPEVYRVPFAYPYRCPTGGTTPEECGRRCLERAVEIIDSQLGAEHVACLVVEPVIGEGGFVVPAPGFLPGLAEYCASNGILFVADEVQSGIGRTGAWFAIEHEGVVPDLVTVAKSLAAGLPLGAVIGRADVMDSPPPGGLGGTFGGNPLACAAALAVLDVVEREGLLERAITLGRSMTARLTEMAERFSLIGDVRGRGAMVAMELVENRETKVPAKAAASRVIEECYRQGVIVLKAGTYDNVIRLLPPLTIEEGLLADGLDVVEKALATAEEGVS